MRESLPTVDMLIAFDAVMETGAFSRAAARLHRTPAAVSYQIKELEQVLGTTLFERRADRSVPTPQARQLTGEASDVLRRVRAFRQHAARLGGYAGVTRIVAAQSLATLWLLPRIGDLATSFPERRFEIVSWSGGMDDRAAPDPPAHIELRWARAESFAQSDRVRLIAEDRALPVCSPAYRRRLGDCRDIATWRRATALLPTGWPDIWDRWTTAAFGRSLEFQQQILLQNSALCLQAAIAGAGIAIAHAPLVADELAAGRLIAAHEVSLPLPQQYHAVDLGSEDTPFFDLFAAWCRYRMAGKSP